MKLHLTLNAFRATCCLALLITLVASPVWTSAQVYDVLVAENFDNTTDLRSDGAFVNDNQSSGFADAFDVSNNYGTPGNVTDNVSHEVGSVFHAADIDGTSGATPSYLEVFDYTATDNDKIGFVGNFAVTSTSGELETGDFLTVQYSINDGVSWTTALTLTGDAGLRTMTANDGKIGINSSLRTKEFDIGDNLNGQVIKIKIAITGFTSAGEAFVLDEFRLVKTRTSVLCESFDNTTNLSTSSGAGTFGSPIESTTPDNNDIYDVTANMSSPTDITDDLSHEDGSVFVLNHRINTSAVDGEELVLLTHTVTDNKHISFRGDFAQFGGNTDPDNNVVIQYSTDNGTTYTTAITLTGNIDSPGKYDVSDDTEKIPLRKFITKGFPIGGNLSGQIIKLKIIFNGLDNPDDGIAFDNFCLESGIAPNVLPVELLSFTGVMKNSVAQLSWSTASEINNSHFEIQRSSNGEEWETLENVRGGGNSNSTLHYSLEDNNPYPNYNYYRLLQVDFNYNTRISKPIVLNNNIEMQTNIYPNPISFHQKLTIESNEDIKSILFYNNLGVLVKQTVNETRNELVKTPADIPSGIYLIKVLTQVGSTTHRLIVE